MPKGRAGGKILTGQMEMVTQAQAERLARDWLAALGRRDPEGLLARCAEEVELTSPFVTQLLGDPRGTIRGKATLRMYFSLAFSLFPDLTVTLLRVYTGVDSLVVEYRGAEDQLAAEMLVLNPAGQIVRVHCHYSPESP